MSITCFEDTDTAPITLSGGEPVEIRELLEDVYLDLDDAGHVVSMTVDRASLRGDLSELGFKRINRGSQQAAQPTN